jgi:hypothetical protein
MEEREERVREWVGMCRRGCRMELHVSVRKGGAKADLFKRKSKPPPYVLCLVWSDAAAGAPANAELVALKVSEDGAVQEDAKRSFQVADIQAIGMVAREDASRAGAGDEYRKAVQIASTRRAEQWLCANKSERLHLVLTVTDLYRSLTGKRLQATGLDADELSEAKASRREGRGGKVDPTARVHFSDEDEEPGEGGTAAKTDEAEEGRGTGAAKAGGGGGLGAEEEEELLRMLNGDMRMDEIPKYKQQMTQKLTALQDAAIQASLSSGDMFSSLQRSMDGVAQVSQHLVDMVNTYDNILKGARSDLVSLRSSSLRYHTVWDNQTALRSAIDSITKDINLDEDYQETLTQGPLVVKGKACPDMLEAIEALAQLTNGCHRKIPREMQGMEAVEGELRAMNNLRFTLSRRVLGLCTSQLKAAINAHGGGGGGGGY